MSLPPIRVCRVVTVSLTFSALLQSQIRAVSASGIDLTLVASPDPELDALAREHGVERRAVDMSRSITPLRDLRSLLRLRRVLQDGRFDIVHSSTPKAGLLSVIAGRLARVPVRAHTFTGQVWVEMHGLRRAVARASDKVIGRLATHCYADSASQRDFLVSERIVADDRISVVADGSVSGVDLTRFDPDLWSGSKRDETRASLGIPSDAMVLTFVGRVNRDKGIAELVAAFEQLTASVPIHLVLVGPNEDERTPLPTEVAGRITAHPRIHSTGRVIDPERLLGASDVFCLPSYREGFGSVVIEAAAMGVPAVVSSVVGLVDAVVADETGLVVPVKDVDALRAALQRLVDQPDLRRLLGDRARTRARELYDSRIVDAALVSEYRRVSR